MKRLSDWPEKLSNFINQQHVFNWSTCNCALFAADAVKEMTGVDFAVEYRGAKSKLDAIKKLKKTCGGNVEDAATKELGDAYDNINNAKRGDVTSFDFGDGPALGINLGKEAVFISEKTGLVYVPITMCRKAWKV